MPKKKIAEKPVLPTADASGMAAAPQKTRAPRASTTAVTHKHKKVAAAVETAPETAVAVPETVAVAISETTIETVPVATYPAQEEIAVRAYLIAESRNFENGSPEDDWRRAEQELLAERQALLS